MVKKVKNKPKQAQKPLSLLQLYGYTHKDFKKRGQQGSRPRLYETNAEKMKAYRLRKQLKEQNSLDSEPFAKL